MRLAIAGDADARLRCEGGCVCCMLCSGMDGGGVGLIVEPLMGS